MEISLERWEAAQEAECLDHLGNLKNDPEYWKGEYITAEYLGINFEEDFKDKFVIEVGAGPQGALLLTKGNFKRAIVVEPLIDTSFTILSLPSSSWSNDITPLRIKSSSPV